MYDGKITNCESCFGIQAFAALTHEPNHILQTVSFCHQFIIIFCHLSHDSLFVNGAFILYATVYFSTLFHLCEEKNYIIIHTDLEQPRFQFERSAVS